MEGLVSSTYLNLHSEKVAYLRKPVPLRTHVPAARHGVRAPTACDILPFPAPRALVLELRTPQHALEAAPEHSLVRREGRRLAPACTIGLGRGPRT
jgi:hypothetical protein